MPKKRRGKNKPKDGWKPLTTLSKENWEEIMTQKVITQGRQPISAKVGWINNQAIIVSDEEDTGDYRWGKVKRVVIHRRNGQRLNDLALIRRAIKAVTGGNKRLALIRLDLMEAEREAGLNGVIVHVFEPGFELPFGQVLPTPEEVEEEEKRRAVASKAMQKIWLDAFGETEPWEQGLASAGFMSPDLIDTDDARDVLLERMVDLLKAGVEPGMFATALAGALLPEQPGEPEHLRIVKAYATSVDLAGMRLYYENPEDYAKLARGIEMLGSFDACSKMADRKNYYETRQLIVWASTEWDASADPEVVRRWDPEDAGAIISAVNSGWSVEIVQMCIDNLTSVWFRREEFDPEPGPELTVAKVLSTNRLIAAWSEITADEFLETDIDVNVAGT